MHPEIEEIYKTPSRHYSVPTAQVMRNAERLLSYIDDINLERTAKFEQTPADSLYLCWNTNDLEFHIECLQNGRISYTFRKGGIGTACGSSTIDDFIPFLEKYLLVVIYFSDIQ